MVVRRNAHYPHEGGLFKALLWRNNRFMSGALGCVHCGDEIGTHEPIVVLTDGGERLTTLADQSHIEGTVYHQECYEDTAEEASSQDPR
jgi:hypothetical protein